MPHLGIAVATTLGGWLNAGLLYATLVRRGDLVADARLNRALRRILLASLLMGVVVWAAAVWLQDWFIAPGVLARVGALAMLVGSGLVVYGAVILLSGAMQVRQLRAMLRRARPAA